MLVSIMWARTVGSSLAINYDTRAICPKFAMESGPGGEDGGLEMLGTFFTFPFSWE